MPMPKTYGTPSTNLWVCIRFVSLAPIGSLFDRDK